MLKKIYICLIVGFGGIYVYFPLINNKKSNIIYIISFSDISKQNAKKKVNKAIKDGVFPNITIEVR